MSFLVTSGLNSGLNTLRQAILDAGAGPATITIQENLVVTLTEPININANLIIEGQAVNGATIRGDKADLSALLSVQSSTLVFNNLTMDKTGTGSYPLLSATDSNVTIDECTVTGFNGNGSGGAMAFYCNNPINMSVSITNSQITNNTAPVFGGAIYYYGTAGNTISFNTTGTTYDNNSAGSGSAIFFNMFNNAITSVFFVNDCIFTNNNGDGSAFVYASNLTCTVSSSQFTDNTGASKTALTVDGSTGSVSITDTNFRRNTSGNAIVLLNNTTNLSVNVADCEFTNNTCTTRGVLCVTNHINSCTIKRTTFSSNTVAQGSLYVSTSVNCDLTLTDCSFTDNQANRGGAVYTECIAGALTVTAEIYVNGNSASDDGGAWYHTGNSLGNTMFDFNNSTISNNRADDVGGGLYISGYANELVVSGCQFTNNSANDGGAIAISDQTTALCDLSNSRFEGNTANRYGAGIFVGSGIQSVTLSTITAFGNHSDNRGGFIYSGFTNAIIINNGSYTSNTASIEGGAFYLTGSGPASINVQDITFSENTSGNSGSAWYINVPTLTGSIDTCIFDNNTAGSTGTIYLRGESVNLLVGNSTFSTNTANNGSAMYVRSPALDLTINNTGFNDNTANNTGSLYTYHDVDGESYVSLTNVQFTNNTANTVGGWYASVHCPTTLIGDQLLFQDNDSTSNVTSLNASAMLVALDSNNTASVQLTNSIFENNSTNNQIFVSSYENLNAGTLNVVSTSNIYRNNKGTPLKLRSENTAPVSLNIDYCSFDNNDTLVSGGVYAFANSNMTVDITNSSFYDNHGNAIGAIGIVRNTEPATNITARISNTTVHNNTSAISAGIIFGFQDNVDLATMTITNCTVTNNIGTTGGVHVLFNGGSAVQTYLYNSVITGNQNADVHANVMPASANNFIGIDTNLNGIANNTNGNHIGTVLDPLDPELGPLINNGGPTLTRLPLLTSPLRNAGDTTWSVGLVYDQRGVGYPRVFDGFVDIGATELQERPICYLGNSIIQVMVDGDIMNVEAREIVTGKPLFRYVN